MHTLQSPSYRQLIQELQIHLTARNYSSRIRKYYIKLAAASLIYMENAGIYSINDIQSADIEEYYQYLLNKPNVIRGGGLSQSYINAHLFALRLLFDYCYYAGITPHTIAMPRRFVQHKADQLVLTEEEIKCLFNEHKSCIHSLCLLILAYACGLRRGEIFHLRRKDVHLNEFKIDIIDSKWRRSRTIPLGDTAATLLKKYNIHATNQLYAQGITPKGDHSFVLDRNGFPITYHQVYSYLKKIAAIKTINANTSRKIYPHIFRHSIATHLANRGVSSEWLQAFMGHSTGDSTMHYIKRKELMFISLYN